MMITKRNPTIAEMFKRISETEQEKELCGLETQPVKTSAMISKVTVTPNPFHTVLTLDVTCEQNRNIIVRMFDGQGKIVKMFSWYLVKGTNVTAINELGNLNSGMFLLDIIDNEGKALFSYKLSKD
ncbi:MAG: T9SS type A sorting domain-containing protein [Flavitalea sp.]